MTLEGNDAARLVAGLFVLMSVGLAIFGVTMYELYSGFAVPPIGRRPQERRSPGYPGVGPKSRSRFAQAQPRVSPEFQHRLAGYGPSRQATTRTGGDGQSGGYGAVAIPPTAPVPTGGHARRGGRRGPAAGPRMRPEAHHSWWPRGPTANYWEIRPAGDVRAAGKFHRRPRIPRPSWPRTPGSNPCTWVRSAVLRAGWPISVPGSAMGTAVVVALPTSRSHGVVEPPGPDRIARGRLAFAHPCRGRRFRIAPGPVAAGEMADTAKDIAAGDLSQRVEVKQQSTEVGELAVAFNTMLDEIQEAFSERDATEDRLRQFLADASHELRTPLTSIQGFAELFRLGAENPRVDKATIMRRIEEESSRMKGLVEDLLLLARLDQVRQTERTPVDLSVLAADACSDATAAAPGRPVTLHAPQPVVILGVEAHLRQALGNLVTNALNHTPQRTAIDVSAESKEGGGRRRAGPRSRAWTQRRWTMSSTVFGKRTRPGPAPERASGCPSWRLLPPSTTGSVTAANAPGGRRRVHPPAASGASAAAQPRRPPSPQSRRRARHPQAPNVPISPGDSEPAVSARGAT